MIDTLKVALFSGNYNYQADGANKALNKLVAFFQENGATVKVFSPTTKTPAFAPAGELISVPSIPVPGRGEYRIGLGLNSELKQEIRDFSPDIFHLSAPDFLGHSALRFAKILKIPVVASFHTRFDTYFRYYGLGSIEAFIKKRMAAFYAQCDWVYVPSLSVGDVLKDENIVGSNMRIWSRGINHENFSRIHRSRTWRLRQGFNDQDVVLAFVGRLVREKGLDDYAKLYDALKNRRLPVKALIVGNGPEFQRVRERMPDAIMTGHLSGDDLSCAYASADIFINPSLTETFGNVTLEAMSSGLPTVCVEATGSSDLVDNGITGWLVPSASSPDWVEQTALLCSDPDMRIRMGRMGSLKSAQYDWSTILRNMLEDYKTLSRASKSASKSSEGSNKALASVAHVS